MRFHSGMALGIGLLSGAVERGSTRIDEMDDATRGLARQFLASDTLHGLGAPVGAHIREDLGTIGEQMAEEHGHTVAGIVFGGQHIGLTDAVPVERGIEQCLGIVTVGVEVGPLALSLESGRNGIVPQRFLLESHLQQFGVALHEVAHDEGHLHDKLPVGVLLLACLGLGLHIIVLALVLLAVLLGPCHGLGILLLVIDALGHAADNLGEVDRLAAQAQVLLEEVGIDDRARNAHRHAAHRQIAASAHGGYSLSGTGKAQQFVGHIGGDGIVVDVLHIAPVNAEGGQSLLGMASQHSGQIDGSGTFRTVESPHGLGPIGMHVHGLRTVAPAGGDSDGGPHALAFKLLGTCCALGHAAYGAVGNDAFHRTAVAVSQIRGNQFGHCTGQTHGFLFKTFAHTALTAIDGRTDSDFGILLHVFQLFLCGLICLCRDNLSQWFFPCDAGDGEAASSNASRLAASPTTHRMSPFRNFRPGGIWESVSLPSSSPTTIQL